MGGLCIPLRFQDQAYKEAERGFIDFFASCFSANNEEAVVKMLQIIEEPAVASVPIIGQNKLTSPLQAALINGFIGHVLDYDDVHEDVQRTPEYCHHSSLTIRTSFRTRNWKTADGGVYRWS